MILGEIKENNKGNKFKIISKNKEKSNNKHTYYNIEFLNSGFIDCVRSDSINKGIVVDKLEKTVFNVGMIGYANTRNNKHEYTIWYDMISRCYNLNDKSYKFYGKKGVIVCERWHRFDYFLKDIKVIQGYEEHLFNSHKLKLDKDIICSDNKCNKLYSLNTCMWVLEEENQKQRTTEYNLKNKKYAIFPDGHEELILNVTEFCKINNLHRQNVNLCLSGKQKSTKGFKFYKK